MPKRVACLFALLIFLFFRSPVFADSTVMINELLPTPNSGNDWVELYNSSQNDIDISGWILDDEGTSSDMFKIPDNTIITKQSFKLFYVSNRLNKDGDTIYLKNGASEIDKYKYTSIETDVSFGRYPDGDNNWSTCSPTPESANSGCNVILEPTPTPTPTPTPSTSSTSTAKSPTPTPKPSATPTKSSSPSPSASNSVLGSKTEEQLSLTSTPEASPAQSAEGEESKGSSKTKIAAMLTGSGVILIGLSIGFFVLYNKTLNKEDNKEEGKEIN